MTEKTLDIDLDSDQFTWRDGYRANGVDATEAAEVLKEIASRDGSIQTQAVVDEARPKESPIHPAFEWRDKVAANEYRKNQARNLVRSVRVIDAPADKKEVINVTVQTVPAFVFAGSGNDKTPNGYYPAVHVLSDLDLFDRAMQDALAKLRAAERSVEDLRRLANTAENRDTLTALSIAAQALSTAQAAIREVRH